MEKHKWLWKRKSFNGSPGGSESSDSASSPAEKDSCNQEDLKGHSSGSDLSEEFASAAVGQDNDAEEAVKTLTEKLSAALVNANAKEDLVKQHSKVAEEAVAGWEEAEIELTILKEKLESASQQKIKLEDHVNQLNGALKECVHQLILAREEQEQNILAAVRKATKEWESTKQGFQKRILELECRPPPNTDPEVADRLAALEKDNFALRLELQQVSEELEIRTIERDLSAEAAEAASKQNLESIKKVARLELECRRLRNAASRISQYSDTKSAAASSVSVDSSMNSQSDGTERLTLEEMDICKANNSEMNGKAFDRPRNDEVIGKISVGKIDLMDDFLEMEKLAALPDVGKECSSENENRLKAEIDALVNCKVELAEKLEKLDKEKAVLQDALRESQEIFKASEDQLIGAEAKMEDLHKELDISKEAKHFLEKQVSESQMTIKASQLQLQKAMMRLEELQMELDMANGMKRSLESMLAESRESESTVEELRVQLRDAEMKLRELQKELNQASKAKDILLSQITELDARSMEMSAKVQTLEEEVENEKVRSEEMVIKCQNLEEQLLKKEEEFLLLQNETSNRKVSMKQEHVDVAAGKLVECQKTILSLRKQLESLATLEDFLIDTTNIPKFPALGAMASGENGELQMLYPHRTFIPKSDDDTMQLSGKEYDDGKLLALSLSSTSTVVPASQTSSEKNRNGFAKFFSRTKNGIQLEI
ncbi:hypothetical protein MLD38_022456 [Melastoma candidum]|uniref:Uncharacterized protein n=1 Tax=Melastoma candidum TaxID=119954 RepID=A0ACB9QJB1_9MYRT|nr:hypothetical protein MLD38_022456 [Melastoma candidum]